MKTVLKNEMTESEAQDTVVITENEAKAIRNVLAGIRIQLDGLSTMLDSCGVQDWIPNGSPRSLANLQFTIERKD